MKTFLRALSIACLPLATALAAQAAADAYRFAREIPVGGDGTVTIVHEDSPDRFTPVQTLRTELRARTMAVDPKSHKLHLAPAQFAPVPANEHRRPQIIGGSFKVLVYEMANKP